ncbi:molecular chaperone [Adlercreutzia sp. ZJ138]|uniref:TorD/DmsD family molecular chaperone n=1 Tax=Adlercreutzia sp. ZJ138 TaxID=2709405 RepID=UPI001F14E96D|nr:molecular chaperone TorD family protein [Adlercreutzia sp. ZJ138]
MANEELQQIMQSRARMYGLLSRVHFKEVDEDFLKELKHMHFPQNTGNAEVDDAYLRLYVFLRKTHETVLDDLAVDYARAFIGSGTLDTRAAYPFESVYTSNTGLTMQDARDEVLAIYRSQGLDKSDSWRESEDHLALELLFMKELSERTHIALKTEDETEAISLLAVQKNFLEDHILNWIDMFAGDVPEYTKFDFYRAFADLTLAYTREDHNLLAELLSEDDDQVKEA